VIRYPNTSKFNQVIGEQYRIASAVLDGARGRGFLGLPGFKHRESSIMLFEQLLVSAPYSEYAPLALMSIAKAHQMFGNAEDAIDALDRMINTYPKKPADTRRLPAARPGARLTRRGVRVRSDVDQGIHHLF